MPRQNEPLSRQCAVTRAVLPVDELLRFVAGPDGAIVVDLKRRLPGRGVWVSARAETVRTAIAKKMLGRSLGDGAFAPTDLFDQVCDQLTQSVLSSLSLARKSGALIAGFDQVAAAIKDGRVAALIQAAEAGDDGVGKLRAAIRHQTANGGTIPVVRRLTERELSLALGRPHVIHAALLVGQASRHALDEVARLARFIDEPDGEPPYFMQPRGSDRRAENI